MIIVSNRGEREPVQKRTALATSELSDGTVVIETELAEAVREVIGAAESANTRRAYAAQMAKFRAWCRRRGTDRGSGVTGDRCNLPR